MAAEQSSPLGDLASEGRRRRTRENAEYRAELERIAPFERIARELIRQRDALGLTQRELADRVGTSVTAISRLESGTHEPNLSTLRRVASALELEVTVRPVETDLVR